MKKLLVSPLARSRYPLAIAAGLALAAAFPNIGIAGLAWVAPGLLLAAALGKRGSECFRIGYVGALAYYLTWLYWLLLIPYRWHGIPFGPAAGWLALSGFMALYPAAWVWLMAGSRQSGGQSGQGGTEFPGSDPEPGAWHLGLTTPSLLPRTWTGRTVWALCGAAAWVAFEMIAARFLGGFPWDLLGVSQYQMVPLIQVASITGVYGISFLIVWFSLSLLSAGMLVLRRPTARSIWLLEILLPVLVVALAFNFGFRRIHHSPPPARTLKVTLFQPSIPQAVIWNSEKSAQQFRETLRLCEQGLTNQTDLLIWPESAIPELLRYDEETAVAITGLAQRHHVWMIVGADDYKQHPNSTKAWDGDFYNCSFLISPEGKLVDRYRKRSLVIFGEYIPFARWLPFLKWFTPIQGGYTPGDSAVPFDLKDLNATASALICFEDVFPQIGRSYAGAGVDFLVNLTNDGWFGESAEQWQHAATALFRSVENGVPLIRCTNNGLTCWIDAQGRIRQIFRDAKGSVYGAGLLTVDIPLPPPGQRPPPTFYHEHGDWFGWSCVGIAALMLAWTVYRNRATRSVSAFSCS